MTSTDFFDGQIGLNWLPLTPHRLFALEAFSKIGFRLLLMMNNFEILDHSFLSFFTIKQLFGLLQSKIICTLCKLIGNLNKHLNANKNQVGGICFQALNCVCVPKDVAKSAKMHFHTNWPNLCAFTEMLRNLKLRQFARQRTHDCLFDFFKVLIGNEPHCSCCVKRFSYGTIWRTRQLNTKLTLQQE